ncbi:MAG TPA: SRPBCC family protein [Candidatus Saccharimonadales bacterium]|jgi:uncharacterized protein YndB with AHSA1/START domain|nr:SRPBCC family protein [Candidatus Saccharimonadales bacterium]
MARNLMAVLIVCLLAPALAPAEVKDSSANGFTITITLNIQAPPENVYERFMRIGNWWSPEHTFSRDAHNLSIEEKAGGCWCEKLPNQGGVRHMQVVYLAPGKRIVMNGGLGPLQSVAAAGAMEITFAPAEGGTKMKMTYAVMGYQPAGMNTWAAPIDSVLTEQLTRLKNFVEKGDPALKAEPAPKP